MSWLLLFRMPSYTQPRVVRKSLRLPLRFVHLGQESGWRDGNDQPNEKFEMSFVELFGVSNQRSPALLARSIEALETYGSVRNTRQLLFSN